MLHIPLTNLLLLAAKQKPYKKQKQNNNKNYLLTKNIEEFSGEKKVRRMGQHAKRERKKNKQKTNKPGLCRRTRKEIAKWNLITA